MIASATEALKFRKSRFRQKMRIAVNGGVCDFLLTATPPTRKSMSTSQLMHWLQPDH
jgi:hypothetical protein